MKIRAVITGATGMVGEGVLHECLLHRDVESVLSISRRSCGLRHEKLKEVLHEGAIIDQKDTFEDGIRHVGEMIKGSCSILILTEVGVLAAWDRYGRTPVVLARKPGAFAVSLETCAFPNLDYEVDRFLGPGEIVRIGPDGYENLVPPGDKLQICSFLWVYYGYPASDYEGINPENVRNRCGAFLDRNDSVKVDVVAGIPDSGIGHGLGYASEARLPFRRPFVKYTELLGEVRRQLGDLRVALVRAGARDDEQKALGRSISQLDELFLLVVVGEFNAGKSAVINALLGEQVLEEGVTPTTSRIEVLKHGPERTRTPSGGGYEEITLPVPILGEMCVVDTPGTNAVVRGHEALTREFVPRSDLVLFVTSADRPFTESERAFLEAIRDWGKKVVVAVNKTDILDRPADVDKWAKLMMLVAL